MKDFSIAIPSSWPLVSKDSNGVPSPSSGKIVLIASAPEAQNGFANNIVILEESISGTTTSKELALASKIGIKKEFYTYKEIESGDMIFSDEETSHLSVFLAQYNKNTPKANFLQTVRICDSKSFTLTLSVSKDVTDFTRYKNLISTFQCKSN